MLMRLAYMSVGLWPIRTEPHFGRITSGLPVTHRGPEIYPREARFAPRRIMHVSKFRRCSNSPQSRHCPSGLLNRGRVARLSQRANVNQKFAQELVWLHECRKVPCPLNQRHTLDGRDNVIEKSLRQFRRG
jgi:hypothetical protein